MGNLESDVADFLDKFIDRAVLAVHAHEAHICDLVESSKMVGDNCPDLLRCHLAIVIGKQVFLGTIHELLNLFIGNIELVTRPLDAAEDLITVLWCAVTIGLDNGQAQLLLKSLFRGESPLAGDAQPAPADGRPAFRQAGIDNLVVVLSAGWTEHIVTCL